MAEKKIEPRRKNIFVSMRNEGYTLQHIADTPNIRRGTVIIVRFKKRDNTENKSWSKDQGFFTPEIKELLI